MVAPVGKDKGSPKDEAVVSSREGVLKPATKIIMEIFIVTHDDHLQLLLALPLGLLRLPAARPLLRPVGQLRWARA